MSFAIFFRCIFSDIGLVYLDKKIINIDRYIAVSTSKGMHIPCRVKSDDSNLSFYTYDFYVVILRPLGTFKSSKPDNNF